MSIHEIEIDLEKGFDDFMRENGLDPDKYKTDDSSGYSGSPNNGFFSGFGIL